MLKFSYLLVSFFLIIQTHCSEIFKKTLHSKKILPSICFGIPENSKRLIVIPTSIDQKELKKLQKHFSNRAISISNDIGVTEYILEFLNLGKKTENRQNKLLLMKEIQESISLSHLEMAAMMATVDCERDRAMQFASHLDLITNQEVNRLGVLSIVMTMIGTSMAAALELTNNTNQFYLATDVTFAILAGYYAFSSLNLSAEGEFFHSNNLLRDLKNGSNETGLFYSTVWNFLNNENYPGEVSEREEIMAVWEKDGITEDEEKLFFSDGGKYTSAQLYKLVLKLDTLKTRMAYMQLELRQLQEELSEVEQKVY